MCCKPALEGVATVPSEGPRYVVMDASPPQTREVVSFGPFELVASERLLTKDGVPVELGARALDILIALLSQPNEIISKKDLLAQVWPDVTVEASSMRVHVGGLRVAMGRGAHASAPRWPVAVSASPPRSRGRAIITVSIRLSEVFRTSICRAV